MDSSVQDVRAPRLLLIHRAVTAGAAVMICLLLLRAVQTVDPYFDSLAYHLPFAARLAGICSDACYQLGVFMEAAYDGYPKLYHRLQALVWRITGHAHVVDVLNIVALAVYCGLLRRWFGVPPAWTVCGLLAVPLIQIHATATYIDLPVNLAVASAILALHVFARAPEAFGWSRLAVLFGCIAFAAHSKPQMIVVAAVLEIGFAVAAGVLLARGRRVGPFVPGRAASWIGLACLLVVVGCVTAAKSIDNLIDHGNPVYPVRVELLGITLDGPTKAGAGEDSIAEDWRAVPSPLRWLASVLEIGAYDHRQVPWTFDQGYCKTTLVWDGCWRPVTASFRMGGFFVPYVLGLLGFLAWASGSQSSQERRRMAAVMIGTTVLASVLPRSHELRFYSFWMIVLVTLCLVGAFDSCSQQRRHRADQARALLGGIVLVTLISVSLMSKGQYIDPTGPDLQSMIDTLDIRRHIDALSDGDVACVDPAWAPHAFLFAPIFHPGRSYTVVNDVAGPCNKLIPAPVAARQSTARP